MEKIPMRCTRRFAHDKATKVIPETTSRRTRIDHIEDDEIREWMQQRNHLKVRIQRASTVALDQQGNIPNLKTQRNHLKKRINKRTAKLQQDRIEALAMEVEQFKNTQQSYEAMKGETKTGLELTNGEGAAVSNVDEQMAIIIDFYEKGSWKYNALPNRSSPLIEENNQRRS
jgi:hypothetical protein